MHCAIWLNLLKLVLPYNKTKFYPNFWCIVHTMFYCFLTNIIIIRPLCQSIPCFTVSWLASLLSDHSVGPYHVLLFPDIHHYYQTTLLVHAILLCCFLTYITIIRPLCWSMPCFTVSWLRPLCCSIPCFSVSWLTSLLSDSVGQYHVLLFPDLHH